MKSLTGFLLVVGFILILGWKSMFQIALGFSCMAIGIFLYSVHEHMMALWYASTDQPSRRMELESPVTFAPARSPETPLPIVEARPRFERDLDL